MVLPYQQWVVKGACVSVTAITPAFREDQRICVKQIDECSTARFGRGANVPEIPFVFLPLKGQIIYPAKEIIFTDVPDAICAVTSAQYLSPSGWVTLRDLIDNDVPFSLYRDEGSTFLQWRGSVALHSRLEGRLVAVHVLCSTPEQSRLATSCAAFRVAGASQNVLLDVKSIPFHAGEIVTAEPATQSQNLSVLELLAICVCVLMLIFIYAAGIIFYVHYKQRQKRKEKDPELNMSNTMSTDNSSTMDSRIDMDNVQLKTNPLLGMANLTSDFLHDAGLSDVSERTEDTLDSPKNNNKFQKTHTNIVSAVVHTRRNKPIRVMGRTTSNPERINERIYRRSVSPDTLERAPHSDLSIIDCTMDNNIFSRQPLQNGEIIRKRLYFNPVFFETEHLKNPPPAAIEFLMKIREIMAVAKERMSSKRYIPVLSDIPEEELYHTIDLGWDIPCARRGRRFSAISLKHENSRKSGHCGGCPGCDTNNKVQKNILLARSNSCKTCVSDDYKQRIVRKWLDEVPNPPQTTTKPVKSVAKVSGTPRVIESKTKNQPSSPQNNTVQREQAKELDVQSIVTDKKSDSLKKNKITKHDTPPLIVRPKEVHAENIKAIVAPEQKTLTNHKSRRIRRKLPPPPPPPTCPPEPPKEEEPEPILPEVKMKMEAVIRELNIFKRTESTAPDNVVEKSGLHVAPKIIIPVAAADSQYYSDDNLLHDNRKKDFTMSRDSTMDFDSLERNAMRRRRFSLACEPEFTQQVEFRHQNLEPSRQNLSRSWRDIKKEVDNSLFVSKPLSNSQYGSKSEIFINIADPIYDNVKPGSLTIQVSGSPVENRRNQTEEFDPDTLDRKPKREGNIRVEKILLKSGGSFKFKNPDNVHEKSKTPPEAVFTRKIGSLREIYEAKVQEKDAGFYNRRCSIPFSPERSDHSRSLKTPDLIRQVEGQREHKPPIPPKHRRVLESPPKINNVIRESPPGDKRRLFEERDRFAAYTKLDNISARRSGRRSARTRSRRTDLRKLYRTEDSGYMSTDSNDSRRAQYLMQLRPKSLLSQLSAPKVVAKPPAIPMDTDTDDLESLCDGHSESGGESVETDSVFFGNFDDSKDMLLELGLSGFEIRNKGMSQDQIDSGFMGETNIILSGDSDSEHRSVISIITGCDGRASAASITKIDDPQYMHSVEC
ncbi:hypothetical protein ACJJTC_003095 [Scirpophaga incertulas]